MIEDLLKIAFTLLGGEDSNKNRSYNRTEINKEFSKTKKEKHIKYKIQGFAKDGYTNKKLKLGGKWDYDHIVSSKKSFDYFKKDHSDKEIAKIINIDKNIVPTDRTINKCKGKYELHQVSDRLLKYGADPNLMKKAERNAWESMIKESEKIKKNQNKSIWGRLFG